MTKEKITTTWQPHESFQIPLMVNIGGEEPRLMRIGNAAGASKCVLYVSQVEQIDSLIDRLLEIRTEYNNINSK